MKKLMIVLFLTAFCTTIAYAQGAPVTGKDWLKLSKKDRAQLITSFIQDVKKEGITIQKGAIFYCKKLDRLYSRKPNLLTEPVWKVLKTAMIMEYDWKVPGKDSDTIAKEWLGEKLYNKNKARLNKK